MPTHYTNLGYSALIPYPEKEGPILCFIKSVDVQIGRMPNAELLEGLQIFSSKSTTSAEGIAASILSQLGSVSGSVGPQRAATKLITVAAGLPALQRKLVEQIQAGQYIEFCKLPPAKGCSRPLSGQEDGHILVVRAEDLSGTRNMMPDLATWLQYFALYMAAVTSKEMDHTNNLLAYMVTIAKASTKYSWPFWVIYDCQEAANNGLKDWSNVDPSI